jgi:enamine deaminase RidA (YjgF/YER057c/UK114 family)
MASRIRADPHANASLSGRMKGIKRLGGGAPWEPIVGYVRAVKAGEWLLVSGTTSFDEHGVIVGRGQMYAQARQAINNIEAALRKAGMTLGDVVRTRIFLTDMGAFDAVARAHREAFGANPPACTAIEVSRLVHSDMMIEIEADAYDGAAHVESSSGSRRRLARKPRTTRSSPRQ